MDTIFLLVLACAVVIVILATLFKLTVGKRASQHRYRQVPLMTENELEFFGRLQRALPHLYIFPQVAMSALIKPVDSFKANRAAYFAINKKIVDYALFTKSMDLVAIVELDDSKHDLQRDAKRDANTRCAGIETVRWHSQKKPNEAAIAARIHDL